MIRALLILSFLFACGGSAAAQQTVIPNYATARDSFFWPQLYANGGESIYCAAMFGPGERLTVEHAYPASWIAEMNGCPNRTECDVPAYLFAEADLHNLWPALGRINSSRGSLAFGEIEPDRHRFSDICDDYERTSGADAIVEPRDSVKGDLARSLLYMSIMYDLPLFDMGPMLMQWHADDPPDEIERIRNDEIERLQGTRNPFIDGL